MVPRSDSNTGPGHWTNLPVVDLLLEADGMHSAAVQSARAARRDDKRKRFQGTLAKLLLSVLFRINLAAQLARRLCMWLPAAARETALESAIRINFPLLASKRHMFAITFIKTLGNGGRLVRGMGLGSLCVHTVGWLIVTNCSIILSVTPCGARSPEQTD